MADTSQVKEITARLEQGVKDLFASDTYADYLKTMSRFHQYSTRNTLLIHMQMPGATHVAGFGAWQTKFGRHVVKGAKSIKILAPTPFVIREEKEKLDPDTRLPVLGEDGMPIVEETERHIARFKVVSVFDISQTDGKPLPTLTRDLTGNVEQYAAFIDALKAVSLLPVVFELLPNNMDGVCRFGDKIAIREGMSEIQTVSAVIHEMTHAKLHDLTLIVDKDESAKPKDLRTEEVEAESVSYAVCQYFGIETGANSFGYLAEWSKGRELKELNASLDTIRKTAAELIDAIDGKFREIVKERNIVLAIGEEQAALDEPTAVVEQATDIPADRPTPGAVYARDSNQVSDIVGQDEAYANAFLNADEQSARDECDAAVNRAVMGLYAESEEYIELFRQYADNPDFKARLEDYVFMRNYLEPKTAQRNAMPDAAALVEPSAAEPEQIPILAEYARAKSDLLVGANVLMTPVFVEGNFNRAGKKIRVTVEEPAGKYQLFSREEHDDKVLYFMTASGRIDRTAEYFRNEWDEQQRKYVNIRPAEAEFDEIIPQIAEQFARDMAEPEKWAKYQHAAALNRLDECEAHNAPVRKLREEADRIQREGEKREEQERKRQNQEIFDARVDEIAEAIKDGKTISVSYDMYMYDGKNPVLDLFRLYGINLPLRTQGWINSGLAEISENGYRYYTSNHKRNSTVFSDYFAKLREAIRLMPIEQIRENTKNPDTAVKEANKTVENRLYEAFAKLFPQIASGEYSYLRLESGGFEPLSIEWIGDNRVSVMHTYTMNGDLMYDPMMTFQIDSGARTMTATEYEQSMPPLYQRVDEDGSGLSVDGNGHEQRLRNLRMSLDGFASQWLDNITQQGYMPVRANMEIDVEDVRITFGADGKPVMPEPQPGYEEWSEPATAENAPEQPGIPSDNISDYLSYKPEKQYDLGYGYKGNGLTVWNRAEEKDGDYLTVAHIGRDRTVTFYDKDMPEDVRAQIEDVARTSKGQEFDPLSESYEISVFTHEDGGYDFVAGSFDNRQDAEAFARLLDKDGFYGVSLNVIDRDTNEEHSLSVSISLEDAQKNENAIKQYAEFKEGFDPTPQPKDNILLPDPSIGYSEMNLYGYSDDVMLPLTQARAVELFDLDHAVYLLYPDNTEAMAFDRDEIFNHIGLFGIEREEWEASREFAAMKAAAENSESSLEADLLYGNVDRFGIYQLKGGDEMRDYLFEAYARLNDRGLSVGRGNYELVCTMPFTDEMKPLTDKNAFLNQIYETFNIAHPKGYTGRSVSVSDVIVLKHDGEISSHYVDSFGFRELPAFLGNETQKARIEEPPAQTYSQVGNTPKAERTVATKDDRPPAQKPKLTLTERLEANKRKAASQGQPDAAKHDKHREV